MLEKYRPGTLFHVAVLPVLKPMDFSIRVLREAKYNHKPYLYPIGFVGLIAIAGGAFVAAPLSVVLGLTDAAISLATAPLRSQIRR